MRTVFAILFLGVSAVANAQEQFKPAWQKVKKTNTIKINLLSPIMNAVTVAYEKDFGSDASWLVTASYMNYGYDEIYEHSSDDYSTEYITSTHITPEIRQTLIGNERDNIYVGAFMRYIFADYFYQSQRDVYYGFPNPITAKTIHKQVGTYHAIGLGILAGRKYTFKNRFVIDYFAGVVYTRIVHAYSREIFVNHPVYAGYTPQKDITSYNTNSFEGGSLIPKAYMNGYGIRAGIMLGYKF